MRCFNLVLFTSIFKASLASASSRPPLAEDSTFVKENFKFYSHRKNNWYQKIGHRKDISIQTLSLARSSAKTEGNNLSSVQRTLSGSESFSYSGIPTMSKGNRPGNSGNLENNFDTECNHPPFRPLSSSLRAAECSPLRLSSVLKRGAAANRVTPHLKRI